MPEFQPLRSDYDFLEGKYFERMQPAAGVSAGIGVSYETCRQYCADGGTDRCDAFIWAPQGCKNWDGTHNIAALCLIYDGDNHGQKANVGEAVVVGLNRQCNCGYGDACEVFVKTSFSATDSGRLTWAIVGISVFQLVFTLCLFCIVWRRVRSYLK
eukprot:TRINITY_DN20912_c0_g1_i1.p1 TRINITY_DN20912_c0_g1~~TRINITY_DN20912_c0_g1_i1.p1  ORF type:complete len:156 (+),score=13.99 TRINITY_DN20912_c0_g1_i1:202-669(+)